MNRYIRRFSLQIALNSLCIRNEETDGPTDP